MQLNILITKLVPAAKMFNQLCEDFKARVEKVKAEVDFKRRRLLLE
jgi:hypothetical protein